MKKGPWRDPTSFADRAHDYTTCRFLPVARSAPRASAPAPDPFYSVLRAWEQLCPYPGQVNPDLGGPMVRPTPLATPGSATACVAFHTGAIADECVVAAFATRITLVALHFRLISQRYARGSRGP